MSLVNDNQVKFHARHHINRWIRTLNMTLSVTFQMMSTRRLSELNMRVSLNIKIQQLAHKILIIIPLTIIYNLYILMEQRQTWWLHGGSSGVSSTESNSLG